MERNNSTLVSALVGEHFPLYEFTWIKYLFLILCLRRLKFGNFDDFITTEGPILSPSRLIKPLQDTRQPEIPGKAGRALGNPRKECQRDE